MLVDDLDQNAYRMVKREYICYMCNKKYKKMVQVADLLTNGLICDECGSGFCEIIDADTTQEVRDIANAAKKQVDYDESLEEVKASEGISMIDRLQMIAQSGINDARDVEM